MYNQQPTATQMFIPPQSRRISLFVPAFIKKKICMRFRKIEIISQSEINTLSIAL